MAIMTCSKCGLYGVSPFHRCCGCRASGATKDGHRIEFCALHAAAEDLRDVAQMLLDAGEDCTDTTCLHIVCCATRAARDVIAKAGGQSAPASGEQSEPAS